MVWGREGSSASVTSLYRGHPGGSHNTFRQPREDIARRRGAPPLSTRRDSDDRLIDPNSPHHSTHLLHGGLIKSNDSPKGQMPSIRFISHQDPGSARPSLQFDSISRILPSATDVIRVGRYSEKDGQSYVNSDAPSSAPVGFKSKVVSRKHCEFWFQNGQWYIKDVKSSSGTFLNRLRLSPASTESRPYQVNDGDIIQLGIDFKGGEESIFRCVKMRVECNRDWQKSINPFNIRTLKRLQNLSGENDEDKTDAGSTHTSDCSICLFQVAPCQSLFVAPCSHVWHYKCIRPILTSGSIWGRFQCPNCRAVADLDADVEEISTCWRAAQVERNRHRANGTAREGAENTGQPLGLNDGSHETAGTSGNDATSHNVNGNTSTGNDNVQPGEPQQPPQTDEQPTSFRQHFARYGQSLEAAIQEIDGIVDAAGISSTAPTTSSNAGLLHRNHPNSSTEHLAVEGPMTPRNDIGPFVLDGNPYTLTSTSAPLTWDSGFNRIDYFSQGPSPRPESTPGQELLRPELVPEPEPEQEEL